MTNFNNQLNDYVSGKCGTECPHPLNRIASTGRRDYCSVCGKMVWAQAFYEVEFNAQTMKWATQADVDRMYLELWPNPPIYATELDPDCEISDADPGL